MVALSAAKILCVDSDTNEVERFIRWSSEKEYPYEFETARNIREAQQSIETLKFDLILSNFNFEDGSYANILNIFKGIPTIIVTSEDLNSQLLNSLDEKVEDVVYRNGSDCYLKLLPLKIERSIRIRQRENSLHKEYQKIVQVQKHLHELILVLDMNKRIVFRNGVDYFPETYSEILQAVLPEYRKRFEDAYHKVTGKIKSVHIPFISLNIDKSIHNYSLKLSCLTGEEQKEDLREVVCVFTSIKDEVKIDKDLSKVFTAEEFVSLSPEAIFITDARFTIVDGNNAALKTFLIPTMDDFKGRSILSLISFDKISEQIQANRENGVLVKEFMCSCMRAKGQRFNAELAISKFQTEGEDFFSFMVKDVSQRKRLESRWALFQRFSETTAQSIGISELNGNLIYANPSLFSMIGCKELDACIGQSFIQYLSPKDQLVYENTVISSVLNSSQWRGEMELKVGSKSLPVIINFFGITGEKNEPTYVGFILTDISDLRTIEKALVKSEKKIRDIFNSVNDAIFTSDFDGNILEANKKFNNLIGTASLVQNQHLKSFVPESEWDVFQSELQKSNEKGESIFETRWQRDNELLNLEISSKKVDESESILYIARDISERMDIQRSTLNSLLESEEEDRKKFAYDLHDGIGPLLSSLKFYLKVIEESDTREDITAALDKASESADKAIKQVKDIANQISPHILSSFGLAAAIKFLTNKVQSSVKSRISYHSKLNIRLDREVELAMFRIVEELLKNSIHHAAAQNIFILLDLKENELKLLFKDDGIGFDVERKLKETEKGGLHNLLNRIKILKGTYSYSSIEGKGWEFQSTIHLKTSYEK